MSATLLAARSDVAAARDRVAEVALEVTPVLLDRGADVTRVSALHDRLQRAYDEYERLRAVLALRKAEAGLLEVVAS